MGLKRLLVGGAVVGGVAIFGGAGGFDDETSRDASGEIVGAGGLGAFVLRVGDCVQWPEDDAEGVESVEGVPCANPHDAEVYALFDLTSPAFEASELETDAYDGCISRWQPAIGTVWEDDPELDISTFVPSEESWATGDREVVCFVVPIDEVPRVGSSRV